MQTTAFAEYQLSKLMLGTVQFGTPYGIANRAGQPTYKDVLTILNAALEGGVTCFDTAAAYGNSEAVLGRALHELGVADRVTVVTKVRALNPGEFKKPALAARAIENSVAESLRRLQLDCLPLALFHRESDARYLDVLERLKTKGWVRHVGISCDARPGPAVALASAGAAEALQLPANILDPRHLHSGVLAKAHERHIAVFIRSVYLQGLILMPEQDIPPGLRAVIPARRKFESLAGEAGLEMAELALRYMLSQQGVTCIVIGVELLDQTRRNIALFSKGPLPASLADAVAQTIPELPEQVVSPSMWSKGA